MLKVKAYIQSLNKEKPQSTMMADVYIIKQLENNQYIVNYNGVICGAIFNSITGAYYVDDVYGIIKE